MELDYHQLGILTREEIIFQLHDFIEMAVASGETHVRIVTGKGKVVRPLVQFELRKIKMVKSFEFADYFNGQDGAIEVELSII